MTFVIHEDLKNLIPELTAEEFEALTHSILSEGCREPITVWNGTIVDGHHRYQICTEHGIPYQIREVTFASMDEAKLWIAMALEELYGIRYGGDRGNQHTWEPAGGADSYFYELRKKEKAKQLVDEEMKADPNQICM